MSRNIEYKDSGIEWIGKIPKHWKISPASNMMHKTFSGYAFSNVDYYKATAYPTQQQSYVIKMSDYDEYGFKINNSTSIVNNELTYDKYKIMKGDILLGLSGSVGKMYLVDSLPQERLYLNQRIMAIRGFPNKYIYYIILSPIFDRYVNYVSTSTTISNLSPKDVLKMPIPLPPKEEQEKITDFLDNKVKNINNVIDINKKLIKNYKEQKESLIYETITKGLDKNIEYKDSGIEWIGKIPKHWVLTRLKFVSSIPSTRKNTNHNKEKYVETKNIINGEVIGYEIFYTYNKPSRAQLYPSLNDILFAKMDKTEKVLHINSKNEYVYSNGMFCIRPENINARLMYYMTLSSIFAQYKSYFATGVTQVAINNRDLTNIPIPLPPKEEQKEIADYLDREVKRIDTTIEIKEKQIKLFEEYRDSLIYEYVTGKKLV